MAELREGLKRLAGAGNQVQTLRVGGVSCSLLEQGIPTM